MIYIPEGRRPEGITGRDRLPSDVTNLYHGKSIEHLTRFEDRNNVWPKLMVSYKFMLKWESLNSLDLRNGGVALDLENFNRLELLGSVP